MLGWSIMARACRSASKRAMTCFGVHARLDDLQGHLAADGLGLLGHVDDAHAPLADLLQQLVGADRRARAARSARAGPTVAASSSRATVEEARRPARGRRAAPRPGAAGAASPPQAWSRIGRPLLGDRRSPGPRMKIDSLARAVDRLIVRSSAASVLALHANARIRGGSRHGARKYFPRSAGRSLARRARWRSQARA